MGKREVRWRNTVIAILYRGETWSPISRGHLDRTSFPPSTPLNMISKVIRFCLVFFVPLTFQNLPWKLHVVEHALLLLAMDNYVSVVLFSYTKIFRIIVVRTRNKLDCKFEVIFWILYLISFPPHGERIIIQSIFKTFQTFLYESTCWIRTKRQGNIPIQGVRSLSPHSSSVTLIHTRSLQSWLQSCPYQTSIKSKNHERVQHINYCVRRHARSLRVHSTYSINMRLVLCIRGKSRFTKRARA